MRVGEGRKQDEAGKYHVPDLPHLAVTRLLSTEPKTPLDWDALPAIIGRQITLAV